jgi:hypothetical protein
MAEYEEKAEVIHLSMGMLSGAALTQNMNYHKSEGWVLHKIIDAPPREKVLIYIREKVPR